MNSNGKKIKEYFFQTLIPAFALAFSVLISILPIGCRSSIEGIEFLEGDYSIPQISKVEVLDSNRIGIEFSKPVFVDYANIADSHGDSLENINTTVSEDGLHVDFVSENKMDIGKDYVLDAVLEDGNGNTVTISVDFLGYNDRVAGLALSEWDFR